MKLEDATATNTCEYAFTGRFFRVKLLSRMKCNPMYAVLAVEGISDEIYKVYTWGEEANRCTMIPLHCTQWFALCCTDNYTVHLNGTPVAELATHRMWTITSAQVGTLTAA
jgi:hypothetical protein